MKEAEKTKNDLNNWINLNRLNCEKNRNTGPSSRRWFSGAQCAISTVTINLLKNTNVNGAGTYASNLHSSTWNNTAVCNTVCHKQLGSIQINIH